MAALVALATAFLAAQSGLAFSQEQMHCSMGMAQMAENAVPEHADMSSADCCDGAMPMELCEHMPMLQAETACCRVQQDHSAPKQAPGISTDRVDAAAAPDRGAEVIDSPVRFSPRPILAAHLPPVLDRKTDLRI